MKLYHLEIFKEALEEQDRPEPPLGHPVHTFIKENRASEKIMSDISMLIGLLGHPPNPEAFAENSQALGTLIEQLSKIDIHYTRKENQLFPMLEAHHFPAQPGNHRPRGPQLPPSKKRAYRQ